MDSEDIAFHDIIFLHLSSSSLHCALSTYKDCEQNDVIDFKIFALLFALVIIIIRTLLVTVSRLLIYFA